jgi:hypothetical protein
VLWQHLLPKLEYGLYASYFNKKECKGIDTVVNGTFLPLLKINRNTPRAVVHGPTKYGGIAIPDCYTRQTQHHLKYMIKQLRWDNTLAGDILNTLDNVQLASRFVTPKPLALLHAANIKLYAMKIQIAAAMVLERQLILLLHKVRFVLSLS